LNFEVTLGYRSITCGLVCQSRKSNKDTKERKQKESYK